MINKFLRIYNNYGFYFVAILWFSISSSKLFNFWIPIESQLDAYTEGDSSQRYQLIALLSFSLPLLFFRRHLIWQHIINNKYLFILLGYCALSIIWGYMPLVGLRRLLKATGFIVIIILYLTQKKPFSSFILSVGLSSILVLFCSLSLTVIHPEYAFKNIGGENILCGVCSHKSQLADWAFTATVLFFWQCINSNKKLFYAVLFVICFVVLIYSKTVTSLIMTCISISLISFYYLCRPHGWKGYFSLLIFSLSFTSFIILISSFLTDGNIFDAFFKIFGKDATFTGRAPLWEKIFAFANQKWLLGYGYGTFWLSPQAETIRMTEDWSMFEAHNGYVDTYLHLGVIGCILTGFYFLNGFIGCKETFKFDNNAGILILAYIIALLIGNLFETIFGIQNHEFWFISILVCIRYNLSEQNNSTTNYC